MLGKPVLPPIAGGKAYRRFDSGLLWGYFSHRLTSHKFSPFLVFSFLLDCAAKLGYSRAGPVDDRAMQVKPALLLV